MLMGMKDQFCPFAEDGSKTHSIRAGERWKVGMRVDLYRENRRRKVYELREHRVGDSDCICLEPGTLVKGSKSVHARPLCSAERHHRREQVQTGGMRLIFRAPVVRVEQIEIVCTPNVRPDGWPSAEVAPLYTKTRILIEDQPLNLQEADLFAWRDGFRQPLNCFRMMVDFWRREHGFGRRLFVFRGQIVHWDYASRFDVGGVTSIEQVADAIRIYGYEPDMAAVSSLTLADRKAVEEYCFRAHLRASDNRCRVPKKPAAFDVLLKPLAALPVGPMGNTRGDWSEACDE